jgi:hypothetical protein
MPGIWVGAGIGLPRGSTADSVEQPSENANLDHHDERKGEQNISFALVGPKRVLRWVDAWHVLITFEWRR